MIENTLWKESLTLKGTPEFFADRGGEKVLDENTRMQNELMGLKSEVSRESKEEEKVSPITREDINSLTRRHPIN